MPLLIHKANTCAKQGLIQIISHAYPDEIRREF